MPILDYMDCFPTGPDTVAGKYMRKFWHPVQRAEDIKPGWAKPIRIMSEDFTLYRGESGKPQSSSFAVRTANRNCPSAGSKAMRCAAAFTAGSSTAPANASSNRRRRNPSPRKCAFAVIPPKNISV